MLDQTGTQLCQKASISGYFTNHSLHTYHSCYLAIWESCWTADNAAFQSLNYQWCMPIQDLRTITSDVLNGSTGIQAQHEESKSTSVYCVDTGSKKVNDSLPVMKLEGATNFTINFNWTVNHIHSYYSVCTYG